MRELIWDYMYNPLRDLGRCIKANKPTVIILTIIVMYFYL